MKKLCKVALVCVAFILMVHGLCLAQSTLSSIVGVATDSSGSVVSQANVVAREVSTGVQRTGVTNQVGQYTFSALLPGTYVVTVSKAGFKDVKSSHIILIAAQSVRFDAPLQVGSTSESIEVKSTPPTLNTETAEVGSLLTGQDILRQPIARSILGILVTSPANVTGAGSGVMIGGQRASYTNLTIDGIPTTNNIFGGQSGGMTSDQSEESIAEVKMTDSNGSAETPGFASLMTTTKGGGNNLHGSVFYQTDNAALNAKPFLQSRGLKGPELHWYGLSAGGPVWLPSLYNGRNKTFFFVTWEHRTFPLAAGNTQVFNQNLPTAAFQTGDFSSLLNPTYAPGGTPIQLVNPFTGAPFAGNVISPSLISSVAKTYQQNYYPAINAGNPNSYVNNYVTLASSPEHINRYDIRLDHHFNEKNSITGRYTHQNDPQPQRYDSTLVFKHSAVASFINTYVSDTYVITPNLLNELRLGFARDERNYTSFHKGNAILTQIGLQGITAPPDAGGAPQMSFSSGIQGIGYEMPTQKQVSRNLSLLDNVSWQKEHHSLKFGALITVARPQSTSGNSQFGSFGFNGFATGFDYADFLLGIPSTESLNSNSPNRYNRHNDLGFYAQDSWQASRNLTINFGVRWEYFMPPIDANDIRSNFDPATGAIVLPGLKTKQYVNATLPSAIPLEISPSGFPGRSMLIGNKLNFGPRLGATYRIGDRMVVRGGWGLYYGQLINAVQDALSGGGVFGTSISATNTISNRTPTFQFPSPFSSVSVGGSNCIKQCLGISGTDPNIKTPSTQEWNATVERDLGRSVVASVGYRGYATNNLPYTIDVTIPQASTNPANLTTSLYPLYSRVYVTKSGAIQRMNALDIGLQKKFTTGLTFQLGHTLSKNLSNDNGSGAGDGEGDSPSNPYNLKADYGNVRYVPRHRFLASTVWDLPVGRGKQFGSNMSKLADYVVGGWETSAIVVAQTGNFLTPSYHGILAGGVQQNIRTNKGVALRPNCVGSPNVANPGVNKWFDSSAFALPTLGQYGNCSVGIFQGPGLWSVNMGFHKSVPVGEKVKLKFEANMLNAFNHRNPGNPNTDINSSAVGRITSTNGGTNALNPSVTTANGERHIWAIVRVEF